MRKCNQQAGFSVVELAITLAVIGIVFIAVTPGVLRSTDTLNRNGAARQVMEGIRLAQSSAVTRGGVYLFQWGSDSGTNRLASEYRVVKDTSGSCAIPAVTSGVDGSTVLVGWTDLRRGYGTVRISSIVDANNVALGKIMFRATGASANTCTTGVAFPVTVTIADANGRTRRIEVRNAGSVRLL